jgi:hypothetical protein
MPYRITPQVKRKRKKGGGVAPRPSTNILNANETPWLLLLQAAALSAYCVLTCGNGKPGLVMVIVLS